MGHKDFKWIGILVRTEKSLVDNCTHSSFDVLYRKIFNTICKVIKLTMTEEKVRSGSGFKGRYYIDVR